MLPVLAGVGTYDILGSEIAGNQIINKSTPEAVRIKRSRVDLGENVRDFRCHSHSLLQLAIAVVEREHVDHGLDRDDV